MVDVGGGSGHKTPKGKVDTKEHVECEQWVPYHRLVLWIDSLQKDRMTVNVLLPSGVGENLQVGIFDEGSRMDLTATLPKAMFDVDQMYQPMVWSWKTKGIVTPVCHHMRINTMKRIVKDVRREKRNSSNITWSCSLPKVSDGRTEFKIMPQKDGSRILGVDLWVRSEEADELKSGAGTMLKCFGET